MILGSTQGVEEIKAYISAVLSQASIGSGCRADQFKDPRRENHVPIVCPV